jgi:hypothetical protein
VSASQTQRNKAVTRLAPAIRRRLAAGLGRGPSALNVPVPAAKGVVPGSYITLISPFVPANRIDSTLREAVSAVVSRFEPFEFTLARIDRFPGVLYIAPEPAEPFVELVEALWAEWPEHPPYEGAFESVVPHLTVWFEKLAPGLVGAQRTEPPGLTAELSKALPIHATATTVQLHSMARTWRWSLRASFPLGG